jgi:hypothetical protein
MEPYTWFEFSGQQGSIANETGFSPNGNYFDNDAVSYSIPLVPHAHVENERNIGYNPQTITLYEGPRKCDCCKNWVEKEPTQMPNFAKDKYESAAILLYKGKNHKSDTAIVGGLIALEDSFLEIQSPVIGLLIRPLLAKLGCLAPKNKKITIMSPFRELFHAYSEITEIQRKYSPTSVEFVHLNILIGVLDTLFADFSSEIRELHAKKAISFQHIWTIFPKGMIVYARLDGHDCLLRVEKIASTMSYLSKEISFWTLTCQYIRFDGIRFGWVTQKFYIDKFDGIQHISDLHVYPLGFHSDHQLEQRIRNQGRKILQYQGISHCEYVGQGRTRLQSAPVDNGEEEDYRPQATDTSISHVGASISWSNDRKPLSADSTDQWKSHH